MFLDLAEKLEYKMDQQHYSEAINHTMREYDEVSTAK